MEKTPACDSGQQTHSCGDDGCLTPQRTKKGAASVKTTQKLIITFSIQTSTSNFNLDSIKEALICFQSRDI